MKLINVSNSVKLSEMSRQTYFDPLWLEDAKFKDFQPWLERNPKDRPNTVFRCHVCNRERKLSNMGLNALISHKDGDFHKRRMKAREASKARPSSITSFFRSSSQTGGELDSAISGEPCASSSVLEPVQPSPSISRRPGLESYVYNDDDRVKAEVIWTLNLIKKNHSFKSSDDAPMILRTMFPESVVASKFSCGDKKSRYMCNHGIAPYVRETLLKNVRDDGYVLLFDESLNRHQQKKQMDIWP